MNSTVIRLVYISEGKEIKNTNIRPYIMIVKGISVHNNETKNFVILENQF